ncbi:ABC transporter ATP-binding protein [Cupriavidus sp. TA19]|uniref:ABC transporter ATP-binding protein n=1 Tax=unclassified Cupriavidus TaxID=2640874 RepID=UPI000E2F34EA|nr:MULTISPECIES: ABC transporter ATP-binding protein [unclassified Cupriavidus]BDB29875.1 ABC transporter ATP-binding protein [Cupriavidus sp. P-10]GLC95976.1 ABC transporter ATP-binding protein [Cupriavidus sp. TA19]
MPAAVFEVEDLWSGYGEQQVLRGINLSLAPGSITALIGANGAGKTTFLRTVSGLVRRKRGAVRMDGRELDAQAPHRVVLDGFVQSPEGKQLFLGMSILENLLIGASNRRARQRRSQTLREVFTLFPILEERQHLAASTLSGGQQQMLAVGRALMALPRVLALDEPSLGLAPIMVDRLFDSIRQLRERDMAVLVIEQNVNQVLDMADYGYVIESGTIALSGPGKELLANPHLRATYLGV